MKKVLITGVTSYVGNSLAKWLAEYPASYSVDKISLRDGTWKEKDFSVYDTVVHVAGIAHRKETKENAALYYRVNRDLTYEVAKKAKKEKITHFIFLSSMSVYGLNEGIINEKTRLNPTTHYGISKLQAEERINTLANDDFICTILRPPMIYGKGCKGNYQRLAKLSRKTFLFPDTGNKRSMIFIDNLNVYIKKLIDKPEYKTIFPQNKEYVNTGELVKVIAWHHNKQVKLTKLFNPVISMINIKPIRKVFGNLIYEKSLSDTHELSLIDFKTSIESTEA